MAIRPAWCLSDGHVLVESFNFDWNPGFAPSQKKKNVALAFLISPVQGLCIQKIFFKGQDFYQWPEGMI